MMGLRNRTQQSFWRTAPTRSTDPAVLYQHGVACVAKRDGKGMLATGWALCQVAGLHEHQASDFLTDGYRIWRESPTFDRGQAAAFLADLFGALCSLSPPSVPDDIWSAAPDAVMPASIYFGTRCWAGNELLEISSDPATRSQYAPLVFRSAVESPHEFVPTRTIEFATSYARSQGLAEPWATTLVTAGDSGTTSQPQEDLHPPQDPEPPTPATTDNRPAASASASAPPAEPTRARPKPTPGPQAGRPRSGPPAPQPAPTPTAMTPVQQPAAAEPEPGSPDHAEEAPAAE